MTDGTDLPRTTDRPGTLRTILETFARLRERPLPFLLAWIGIEALSAAALAPVGSWGVQRLIARTDRYAVANQDIVSFLLSWEGLLAGFLAATVSIGAYALARTSTILLAHRRMENGSRGLGTDFRLGVLTTIDAARRVPSVLSLVARQIAILALFAAPFVALIGLIAWIVLRGVDLYWLVNVRPTRYWLGLGGVVVVGAIALLVLVPKLLRWSVALPLVVLDRERPARAMRESVRLTRGRLRSIAAARVGWFVAVEAIVVGALALLAFASKSILAHEVVSLAFTAWLAGLALLANALLVGAQSVVVGVGDSLIVYGIWRRLLDRPEPERVDAPIARRGVPAHLALVGVLAVVAIGAASAFGIVRTANRPVDLELTAHRGAAVVAPENTFASIRAAGALGADRIEIDVMRSRDGALVLAHDVDFRRLANDPRRVADLTLDEIRAIDVGSWFDASFSSERMPTLDEALAMVRDEGIGAPLNVELKVNGDAAELARRTVETLDAFGDTESIITSLSVEALAAVRSIDPDRRVGVILTASFGDFHRMDVDLYSVPVNRATSGLRARARSTGRKIVVWGVHDPDTLTNVALRGFDGVIAPDVGAMRARLDELNDLEPIERLMLAFRARLLE
jgi:glycerophosphoryl diester phosphodiesterase